MQKALQHIGLQLIERGVKIEIDAFDTAVNKNRARVTTTQDDEHVKNLVQSFIEQGWNEELGYAIAVLNPDTNTPVLIDGHHRADAWAKLGNETLPCDYYKLTGVCELESIITAVSLKANDHPPAKANTKHDIKRAVAELISAMDLDPSIDEIAQMIADLNLKGLSKASRVKMAGEIYRDKVAATKIVKASSRIVSQHIQQNFNKYGEIDAVMPCTENSTSFTIARNVMKCVEHYNHTGEVPTAVIYALDCYDAQGVYDARREGMRQMREMFDSIRDVVNTLDANEYPWDIVAAYPQIEKLEGNDPVELN